MRVLDSLGQAYAAEEAALFDLGQAELVDRVPLGYNPRYVSSNDRPANVMDVGDYVLVSGLELRDESGKLLGIGGVLAEITAETPNSFLLRPIATSFPNAKITNATIEKDKEIGDTPIVVYRWSMTGYPLWFYGASALALAGLTYLLFFRK